MNAKQNLENSLFYVQISPRQDLAIYLNKYRDQSNDSSTFSLGKVPEENIRNMPLCYQQAEVFKYNIQSKKVEYFPNYSNTNQNLFLPLNCEKFDAERLAKWTAWSPQGAYQLNYVDS